MERISHGFPAFVNADSRILILGTMPSVKSREAGFYYMHPQNRFWRLISDVYDEPFPEDMPSKCALLTKHKIALFDVLESCDINGSADSTIKNPIPNNIKSLIEKTDITRIFTTGKTALKLYAKYCEKSTGIAAEYLPSPSPANCAVKYADILAEYKKALTE